MLEITIEVSPKKLKTVLGHAISSDLESNWQNRICLLHSVEPMPI